MSGFKNWNDVSDKGYKPCADVSVHVESLSILKEVWGGYSNTTTDLLSRLKQKAKSIQVADASSSNSAVTTAKVADLEQLQRALVTQLQDMPATATAEEVDQAWMNFRGVLFEINRLTILAGFADTSLKDRWDL